jgi:hypothetical protein
MSETLLFALDIYLKIGLGIYLTMLLFIFISMDIMPWDALFMGFMMIFFPTKLISFIIFTLVLIVGWPYHILQMKKVGGFITYLKEKREENG